jgi:hypothetical protein
MYLQMRMYTASAELRPSVKDPKKNSLHQNLDDTVTDEELQLADAAVSTLRGDVTSVWQAIRTEMTASRKPRLTDEENTVDDAGLRIGNFQVTSINADAVNAYIAALEGKGEYQQFKDLFYPPAQLRRIH